MWRTSKEAKREPQRMVVSYHVGSGNLTQVLWESWSALTCWAISPALGLQYFCLDKADIDVTVVYVTPPPHTQIYVRILFILEI